ncbi:popeye domain-containing protein 3 isoform X3 [Glossina fuscipes]|uniref:Popeye domain-containing protein 3 isoform X3 n=1 Tax=Glossina fuscipes TaxID=7396 RepID=A0A9C5ZNV6_9MUSC|nr:popeye domain-containing protein 3 isoform X3 [Glossina fuscipes]
MLLISALALGLVETTNLNTGIAISGSAINSVSVAAVHIPPTTINSIAAGHVNTVIHAGVANAISTSLLESTTMTAVAGGTDAGGGSGGGGGTSANNGATSSSWDNNATIRSANPGDWSIEQCVTWQRPHHLYFQLGNAFLLLAFLAPHGSYGTLWLRAMLTVGSILLGMYGYMIDCAQDFVLWSGLFFGVNFIYFIVILCQLRPVRFDREIEAVYASLFKPLRVSRHQFKKVLNCMKVIRALKYQEVYAQEKVTKVDSLSLVLSGKLVVSQNQRALHIVFPHQFLDSPEWFGVSTDDYFQVSIMAMEESRVLIWHRDKLKLSIMAEPFLQTVFDHILGRDVVKKLMQVTQVSESIASNGFLPSGGYDDAEDKPMLIMKKSIEGHSLTALINRQLQALPRISKYYESGDPNSWRLGRIDETDHETAV